MMEYFFRSFKKKKKETGYIIEVTRKSNKNIYTAVVFNICHTPGKVRSEYKGATTRLGG